jgi:hypothetical protein
LARRWAFSYRTAEEPTTSRRHPQQDPDPGGWTTVVAIACDAERLGDAELHALLGGPGEVTFLPRPGNDRSGSAPGLAQLVGRPLQIGDRLRIRGEATGTTQIVARIAAPAGVLLASFDHVVLRSGDKAVVSVAGSGATPDVGLEIGGRKRSPDLVRRVLGEG